MGGNNSIPANQDTLPDHVACENGNDGVIDKTRETNVVSVNDVNLPYGYDVPDIVSSSTLNTEQSVQVFSDISDSENSDDDFEDALDDLDPLTSSSSKVSLTEFQQLQTSILGKLVSEVEELLVHLSNQTEGISSEQCHVLLSSVNAVTQAYSTVASRNNSPSKQKNGRQESIHASDESGHAHISTNHKLNSEDSESGVDTTSIRGDSLDRNESPIQIFDDESTVSEVQDAKIDGKPGPSMSLSSSNTAWEIDLTYWDSENIVKKKRLATKPILRKHCTESESKFLPPQVHSGIEHISQRKVLDLKRWYCMSRPQIKKSCGISSLVSCWNYLYSSLGHGSLPLLTQEHALTLLGYEPPFDEIPYGTFTGNKTLMRWFRTINNHFHVKGRTYFLYKPQGKNKTCGITSDLALHSLKRGFHDNHTTFIYHCYNHYFCPIGYEDTSLNPEHAYSSIPATEDVDTWVLIGEPSKAYPGIHFKRWADILTDLNCESPDYFDIRQIDKGIQKRKTQKPGGNLHCIITFQKCRLIDTQSSKTVTKSRSKSSSSESTLLDQVTNGYHGDKEAGTFFGDHTDSDVIESESD